MSNVPNGTDFDLVIYNSGWENIDYNYNIDNGDGLTEFLTAGETYYIRVGQRNNVGSYTLNIGHQKKVIDITDNPFLSDSIQYTNQENDYKFIAENDETYRVYFSGIENGCNLSLYIYNSGWEKIQYSYNLSSNEGIKVSLSKGESYFIEVAQYHGYGSYTLTIEKQDK